MRASFESSHVTGDFSDGRLTGRVTIEDDARQFTRNREVFFAVPPEFHAHNDLVAAALPAMLGKQVRAARFNFPISSCCAATLPRYYHLADVGPIDPRMEPRRPGRHIGVTFSGGLDSLAMMIFLGDRAGIDVKIITAEYEGFHREAVGYASYQRDVSCWTNVRRVFGDGSRRFDAAVPLLFGDYADLHSFVTGHNFASIMLHWFDPRLDGTREFELHDLVSAAGGLRELHIARSLHTSGLLKFLVAAAPEQVEAGFHVTAAPDTQKYLFKAMMLRHLYQAMHRPLPPFLQDLRLQRRATGTPSERAIHLWTIWEWRFLDWATAVRVEPRIATVDWTPLESLSLEFFWKHCPRTAAFMPPEIRAPVLAGLESAGIEAYSERDYEELEQVRQFILAVNPPQAVFLEE